MLHSLNCLYFYDRLNSKFPNYFIMECIYSPDLTQESTIIQLSPEESKHCFVRRLKNNDAVVLLNGKGLAAKAILRLDNETKTVSALCKDFKQNYGELEKNITLLLGWLDQRDRLEFALEKCTELGVKRFILTKSQYSSPKKPDAKRLKEKLISAIKQCKRSLLPEIIVTDSVKEASGHINSHIYIADINGEKCTSNKQEICICVGSEGGFSDDEIHFLQKEHPSTSIHLGKTRLRAETATIAATTLFVLA